MNKKDFIIIPNKYDKPCVKCSEMVYCFKGFGVLKKLIGRLPLKANWETYCPNCLNETFNKDIPENPLK